MRLIKQFHNQAYPAFSVYPVLGATEIFARQKRNLWLRNWLRCQSLKIKSHKFPDTKKSTLKGPSIVIWYVWTLKRIGLNFLCSAMYDGAAEGTILIPKIGLFYSWQCLFPAPSPKRKYAETYCGL